MAKKTIVLTGNDLTVNDVYAITHDRAIKVALAPSVFVMARRGQKLLQQNFDKKIIYGVNTGFGPMASHILGRNELIALQYNLIRSHATGMGKPLPEAYVLGAMMVRLNTLAKGYSGVSPELLKKLQQFINERIVPIVPEHGAVGTSGDLVQLAHIALSLIGEGEVVYNGVRQPTAKVLKRLGIAPYSLKPKEGLSLINGTSMMAAIDAILCMEANRLISFSIRLGALSLELTNGFDDSIAAELHAVRPHPGQGKVAEMLRKLLASSGLLRARKKFQKQFEVSETLHVIPEGVQEVYSLRCIPQIVGPAFDTFQRIHREVTTEINSVTDNPILDFKNNTFLHGGNFHGDYMAAGIDQLKASLIKLTMLSERRINFFLNQKINGVFPPFMNLKKPGLTLGLQGLQFVATSTTAHSQSLAFPHHIHSISTNADNQDVVSMGTDAALIASGVVDNAFIVLAIEALTLAQGVTFTGNKIKFAPQSKKLVDEIQKAVPPVHEDRSLAKEMPRLVDLVRTYDVLF
jgi:histidine ammonia-lyase